MSWKAKRGRQLAFDINRISTLFIAEARVRKTTDLVAMIMSDADLEEGDRDSYAVAGEVNKDGFAQYETDAWPYETGLVPNSWEGSRGSFTLR